MKEKRPKEKTYQLVKDFSYRGKRCIVIEHKWTSMVKGISNLLQDYYIGYVSTDLDIPYSELNVNVHGGLTFGLNPKGTMKTTGEISSFALSPSLKKLKKYDGMRFYGFDTGHAWDNPVSANLDYVIEEVKKLADQIIEIENKFYWRRW